MGHGIVHDLLERTGVADLDMTIMFAECHTLPRVGDFSKSPPGREPWAIAENWQLDDGSQLALDRVGPDDISREVMVGRRRSGA